MPIPQLRKRSSRVYGAVQSEGRLLRARLSVFRWKKLLWPAVVAAGSLILVGSIVVAVISRDLPDPNRLADRQVAQSTKIYDRTGEHLLYEVYQNQKRTIVDLAHMSPWVPKATVAVEDKHFYEHKGVRVTSILRAGFNNLIGRKTGSGGASTLTQQLIKNTIVGAERRGLAGLFRKIKEAILAVQLEKKYPKDEILQMYLNEIPYGSTNYGVESAAQSYFHKAAVDLTLSEAATLAAMIQAPSRYLNNLNDLRARRDMVIRLMFDQGSITETEKSEAQNAALRIYRTSGIFDAPHFVLYIKQLLAEQFGESLVDTGGLKVITTLDYDKQKIAEKVVKENGDRFAKEANANNAALVALDPKTAQVLAMVGSRDFENEAIGGQFNVAVLGKRQPGSSFKPFVYTAAFEKGYTPETVLYDVTTDFDLRGGAEKYTPKNYDGKENGLVTMRKALQGSLNIPAVKTLYLVGTNEAIDFAKRFGYSTFTGDYGLSLVLGGAEVNLLEHANGYATLANNGVYHSPVNILKVTNSKGETLLEWQESDGTEAVKPEVAATISNVLSDNPARAFMFGINNTLNLPDRPAAAKTGTTNDNKDAWTLGYVPSLAAGVWVGNTIPAPMKSGGNKLAGVIWNQFMREALKGVRPESFPAALPNDATKPVLRGGDGGIRLSLNRLTGRIAASSTPENLIVEKTFLPPHDILHYVKRDDPRGSAPENPSDDSQYQNWETALQDLVVREQEKGRAVTLEEPPTQYDTPQSLELAPTIEITNPAAGQVVTTRNIAIEVKAGAPRGVAQVLYYLDGSSIGSSNQYPFNLNYYAQRLAKGTHTIRAIAQDDIGNSTSREAQFDLNAEFDPPSFDWFDASPLSVKSDTYPRTFYLVPFRWDDIKDIKIYLISSTEEKLIYTFNHLEDKLFNNQLFFTWQHSPGAGSYTLHGVMTDNNGVVVEKSLGVSVN